MCAMCRRSAVVLAVRTLSHHDSSSAPSTVSASADGRSGTFWIAIWMASAASSRSAEIYGLEFLARDVQDSADNTTFFAMIAPR